MKHQPDKTNNHRDVFNPKWFRKAKMAAGYSGPYLDSFKKKTAAGCYWQQETESATESDSAGNAPVNE